MTELRRKKIAALLRQHGLGDETQHAIQNFPGGGARESRGENRGGILRLSGEFACEQDADEGHRKLESFSRARGCANDGERHR